MKWSIVSCLAGLSLMLAVAQPATAQNITIERLTELCRPQLEARERENMIPFFEGELETGREYLAVEEIRSFEAKLADSRANGLNAAHVRYVVDHYRRYDDDLLRNALVPSPGDDPYHYAAVRCLAEALLAGGTGVPGQNTPILQALEGPLGLRDKNPAPTGLAAPTTEERYFLKVRVINIDLEECDQDCPHLGGELSVYRGDLNIWQAMGAGFSSERHLGDPLLAGTEWRIRINPSFDHYDCEVPGGGSVPADERAINIAGAVHVGDVTCTLTPAGREEFVRIRTRRETPISDKSVPAPEK